MLRDNGRDSVGMDNAANPDNRQLAAMQVFPAINPYCSDIILWPILPLYIALLVYGSRQYNEDHYILLHKTVTTLPLHKWRSLRRRSTTAIWLSTVAVIADILLVIRLS